jgi:N-acetylglucosamine kinase-like BadF-type ATPase
MTGARASRSGSPSAAAAPAAVLAVDGGNLKTDVALVGCDGAVLAAVRGTSISHQAVGLRAGVETLETLVSIVASRAGLDPSTRPLAEIAAFAVAGADFRRHEAMLRRAYGRTGAAPDTRIWNDAFAPLRAGTDGVGVAVICGSGMNAAAVSPSGRVARFPALGDISGDWGGGGGLGGEALWHAVRGRDGRGPRTVLEELVPAHFGLHRPLSVTVALEEHRLGSGRLRELAPIVFEAAAGGDEVARALVDRQADEIVAMAVALLRRLGMVRAAVPIVVGGGVSRTEEAGFWARIDRRLHEAAPNVTLRRLDGPPVLGSALLGLDAIQLDPAERAAAERLVRAELTHDRIERVQPEEHDRFHAAAFGREMMAARRRRHPHR